MNYNFPQIHVDKIDTEDDIWFAFEKIINNYKDGDFLRNSVDLETDTTYNRNIMQPLAYVLHILKVGFADAGYAFEGDIKTDDTFKKLCVYADATYYTTFEQESINIIQSSSDGEIVYVPPRQVGHTLVNGYYYSKYFFSQVILHPGKYRITGKIKMRLFWFAEEASYVIKYRNQILVEQKELPEDSIIKFR